MIREAKSKGKKLSDVMTGIGKKYYSFGSFDSLLTSNISEQQISNHVAYPFSISFDVNNIFLINENIQ